MNTNTTIIAELHNDSTVVSHARPSNEPYWKYSEDEILSDFRGYLASTYGEHYKSGSKEIECFDAWIALGDSTPTFRNTALKYLWRYGSKDGNNKKDLLKALHYIMLMLHVDHYKGPPS